MHKKKTKTKMEREKEVERLKGIERKTKREKWREMGTKR
jgi:hypothetical protein